jgi:L-alanine-DL-glutamate epimerase-like enolase superfamily enzyme
VGGAYRPAAGPAAPRSEGVLRQVIGAIQNALLDLAARALCVPIYVPFGGPVRERIPLYWLASAVASPVYP